jgi:hypothetical protein
VYCLELCEVHNKPAMASRFKVVHAHVVAAFEREQQARLQIEAKALRERESAAEVQRLQSEAKVLRERESAAEVRRLQYVALFTDLYANLEI